MNELMKELSDVFDILSAISVSGQNVDNMAAARAKLRSAYKMAETMSKEEKEHGE